MRVLFFSVLLALAAANAVPQGDKPEDDGSPSPAQKPGMCFEEYFMKHPEQIEMFKKKFTDELSDPAVPQDGPLEHKKRWLLRQKEDGHRPHGKRQPWHIIDFSKMRSCGVDMECDGAEKCCRTMCGMRCIKPMFENHEMDKPQEAVAEEPDKEEGEENGEVLTRRKRHASVEDEESSEDDESVGESGKGKGGEKGKCGKKGKGHGKGKGGLKGKGHGKGKGGGEEQVEQPEENVPDKSDIEVEEAEGDHGTRKKRQTSDDVSSEEEAEGESRKGNEGGKGKGGGKGKAGGKGGCKGKDGEKGKGGAKDKGGPEVPE